MHGFGGSEDKLDGYGINPSQWDGAKAAAELSSLHIIHRVMLQKKTKPHHGDYLTKVSEQHLLLTE